MVVVCVSEPEVPVIVSVLVPGAALAATFSKRLLNDVAGFVPKEAVTPFGRPESERLTGLLNPFCAYMSTYAVLVEPWPTVAYELERENDGATTESRSVVVCDSEPDVPVTVSVYCPSGTELPTLRFSWLA
jgi:hypothetical protein